MIRRKKFIAAALGLIAIIAIAWMARQKNGKSREMTVQTVAAEIGDIDVTVEASGEVAPLNRVEMKPPVQGRIEELLVDEGDAVKAGQIMAWMSSSDRAAVLDAARAKGPEELRRWEDTYKPTPLVAPLSGVVILRNVVVGQTVDAGTVVFALSDQLIVVAHVDEVDIGKIHKGMPARVVLDAFPKKSTTGRVMSVLFEGTNVSNVITYAVKIKPDRVPDFFRSQMTANVTFVLDHRKDAVLIPAAAVETGDSGETFVQFPGTENRPPVRRPVTVGLASGENVEIIDGVNEGDRVLVIEKRYVPQGSETADSPLIMRPRSRRQTSSSGNRAGARPAH